MYTKDSLPARIKQVIANNPGLMAEQLASLLDASLTEVRQSLRRLKAAGYVHRDESDCWTILHMTKPKKPPVNRRFPFAMDKARVEINKVWAPHHVRDALVTALFGPANSVSEVAA